VNLCHRLAEVQLLEGSGRESMGSWKKLKMNREKEDDAKRCEGNS
jgi:hypothetical protein